MDILKENLYNLLINENQLDEENKTEYYITVLLPNNKIWQVQLTGITELEDEIVYSFCKINTKDFISLSDNTYNQLWILKTSN